MRDRQRVRVGDVWLAYREADSPGAPPMVLLHGLTSDSSAWETVAGRFRDHWHVIVPDFRGHGDSSWPGAYSFELMRDDVAGLVDQLGLGPAVFVGHSLGGVVAYLLAQKYPERVNCLVLEETPPPTPLGLPAPQRPTGATSFDWAARPAIVGQLNNPAPAWHEQLVRISAPTLVVAGGTGSHLPQDKIADMAARLPSTAAAIR
jgi:3-oxoadipate enol-lactonase